MTKYWITYRLHYGNAGGQSYEQRYKALTTAVKDLGNSRWEEPTSFYALESEHAIEPIAAHLKKAINTTHDLVLIRKLDTQDALVVGTVSDFTIFSLMPYLKYA